MYQRALSGFQVALGPSHRKTQLIMRNLDLLPHTKGVHKGYSSCVYSVAFSSDLNLVTSGLDDKTVKI